MRTCTTERGQVSIPARARKLLGIKPHTVIEWVVEGNSLRAIPIPDDPVAALRGSGRHGAVKRLLADRRRDAKRE